LKNTENASNKEDILMKSKSSKTFKKKITFEYKRTGAMIIRDARKF
jgi:hypothetical protein